MKHYPQFAVLRGFASVWVFFAHAIMIVGLQSSFIPSGQLAVELFMILSGFVITLLRLKSQEPYSVYIFRRFMRLYPLYLVAIVLGLITMKLYLPVLGNGPLFTGDVEKFIARDASVDNHFWMHLAAHLTMLHGAIPDTILPQSALAISGPLWSISLEWQFYIFAPLIIYGLDWHQKRPYLYAFILAVFLLGCWFALKHWTAAIVPAFLPERLEFFVFGVLCALAWQHLIKAHYLLVILSSLFALIVFKLTLHPNKLPLMIWFSVYVTAVLGSRFILTDMLNKLMSLPIAIWIGDRSYGLYVIHMPIMLLVAHYIVLPQAESLKVHGCLALLLLISTPITLSLTALCYKYIELPGIVWARNISNKITKA